MTDQKSAPLHVAVRLVDPLWSIDGVQVSIPDGESPIVFVLRQLFDRVQGEGPWRADVHDGGPVARSLWLHSDGTVTDVVSPNVVDAVAVKSPRGRGPVLGRRALLVTGGLLGLGAVGTVAGFSIHSVLASAPVPSKAPIPTPTAAPAPVGEMLSLDGFIGVRAAGPVVAGVWKNHLVLFDAFKGEKLTGDNDLVFSDLTQVRVFSGGGVSVVDAGKNAGVFVINGKATQYEGKGALLPRGTVPVLVGGTANDRKYFAICNGSLVAVKGPQAGNSLFGGLPGGGTVWAVAGGKVTYVPATGTHRTITLASPLAGAKVTSWVAVSETHTALIWTKGTDSVLAVHATGPGAKGAVELKQPLQNGQTAWADFPLVVIGPGKAGVKASGAPTSVISLQEKKTVATSVPTGAALVGGQLWTPAKAGTWTAGGFTAPSQPVAVGDGFALVAEGEKFVAVPGPSTTTK